MKRFLCSLFLLTALNSLAQNYTGQWKGSFVDKSTSAGNWGGYRCDYVIDLDVHNDKVNGYSYTYFTEGGKKYYTICRLQGFLDKKRKYVEVRETERTKTNVPDEISNSFQIHKLTWRKAGVNEVLEGNWIPAPGQSSINNGYGTTLLTKRQLREIAPNAKLFKPVPKPAAPLTFARPAPKPKVTGIAKSVPKQVTQAPVSAKAKTPIRPAPKTPERPAVIIARQDTIKRETPVIVAAPKEIPHHLPAEFDKRISAIQQTVSVENSTIRIELYDNGEIDGDSVSLIYNGSLILTHKKLTDKPISLDIPVKDDSVNELVMYADNLGTIPPNTALLIVRDGNKRYEVRITSDLRKSGTIRFVHKSKDQ